ncbi:MAG: EndoU domain-containing protein [Myxacorys californica WJT36-NPBG1]|jgi:hypothetical protein|nr:EndoU domain-containing protein [Myxacorys californica WJT36-NPBG1]
MSIFNGYNPNSLLALEQSLHGNTTVSEPSQESSVEKPEASEIPQNDQMEARAFDWDEAIELAYEDEESPEAKAVNWEEDEDRSQEFGLEDNEVPVYDVQAFSVEEEAPPVNDPLSHSNSLFALEQSVYGIPPIAPTVQPFSVEDAEPEQPEHPEIESHAFDWNEAIALEYEGDPESSAQSEAHAFDWDEAISLEYEGAEHPPAESFEWLPTDEDSYGLGLGDKPLTFTVEAFAVEDEEIPTEQAGAFEAETESETIPKETINSDSNASGLKTEDDAALHPVAQPVTDSSGFDVVDEMEDSVKEPAETSHTNDLDHDDEDVLISHSQPDPASEAIPVQATVVNPTHSPQKSAAAIDFEQAAAIDFDALELDALGHSMAETSQSADAETFAADVAAILRGEKTYEPAETTPAPPTERSAPPGPAPKDNAPPSQAQSLPPKLPSAHDVFDQMGRSMAHATAFDLGTFSLEQTFDEFDAVLDEEEKASSFGYDAEEDTPIAPAIGQPLEWNEDELAADVAALSVDQLWQPAMQFQLEENDISTLLENVPPNPNELKSKYLTRLKSEAKKRYGKKYSPTTDDPNISTAVETLWQKASAPKVTAQNLKERYWHHISIGGTKADPMALTGYHWTGYETGDAKFQRIGKPTVTDQCGVYQQKIQHKETQKEKKDASTFFPDAWTEQHFDALFQYFAGRKDFNPNKNGTYPIDAAINGDVTCIGMQILFMPSAQGEGSCIPVWTPPKQSKTQSVDEGISDFPDSEMYAALNLEEQLASDRGAYFADSLSLESDFNAMLETRLKSENLDWQIQLKFFLSQLSSNRKLSELAKDSGALSQLSTAWDILHEQTPTPQLTKIQMTKIEAATDTLARARKGVVLDEAAIRGRLTTFALAVNAAVKNEEIPLEPDFNAKTFNDLLKGRLAFESKYGAWGIPQYRDFLGYLNFDEALKALAHQTGATTLLSVAWDILGDETHSLFNDMLSAVSSLAHAEQGISLDAAAVRDRFKTFTQKSEVVLKKLATDKNSERGMVLTIEVPSAASTDIDTSSYPELALLDQQLQPLIDLIKHMGRQTGEKPWSEWFKEKFATVKGAIPTLATMGVWSGLSAVINKLINAGLIGYSILGYSGTMVTFGANVLTPWQATIEFPKMMKKQLGLYRLKEYGEKKLKLPTTDRVIAAIDTSINSIDWNAVKTAFKVTPFGLLITAYSALKFITLKVKPAVNFYYPQAKALIAAADTIHGGGAQTSENRLAMLTILHLAGTPEKFVQMMTCREKDAWDTLADLIDG